MLRLRCSAALAALTMVACDGGVSAVVLDPLGPAPIDASSPPTLSAPQMFALAVSRSATGSIGGEPATCPAQTDDGTTVTLEGGCTTDDGVEYFGRVTLPSGSTVASPVAGVIRYEGYGADEETDCPSRPGERSRLLFDGTVTMGIDGSTTSFAIDLTFTADGVADDCFEGARDGAIDYTGSFADAGDGQIWNGRGRFGVEGVGVYELETRDEVIDSSVCMHEPLSGTSTIRGDRTVEVFYDGASDCDESSTATWSLDGVPQEGELTNVRCGVAGAGLPGSAWPLGLVALAALALRRRRAR